MTPRVVVTSGDPATGVVGIEEAPHEPCPPGCYSAGCTANHTRPVSLPATVEVAERCTDVDCVRGIAVTIDGYEIGTCLACDGSGFVVLGTATLKGLWRYENLRRFTDNGEGFGPLPPEAYRGRLYVWRDTYDALVPGGLVALLTDWNPR